MSKIKPRECQNIEYKGNWHDKYLEWICGFANAQGAAMSPVAVVLAVVEVV